MGDNDEFDNQFAIDTKNEDRLYLVCGNCYWMLMLPVYPSLDNALNAARFHYKTCKKELVP